ncbi:hypothetical protein KIPB_012726, partial [Kipferlia bialata]
LSHIHSLTETDTSTAMLGISIEPIGELDAKQHQRTMQLQPSQHQTLDRVAKKMLRNFETYMLSHEAPLVNGTSAIPGTSVSRWANEFDRRIRFNPRFWEGIDT